MELKGSDLDKRTLQVVDQAYPDFINSDVLKEKIGIPLEKKVLERQLSRLAGAVLAKQMKKARGSV